MWAVLWNPFLVYHYQYWLVVYTLMNDTSRFVLSCVYMKYVYEEYDTHPDYFGRSLIPNILHSVRGAI